MEINVICPINHFRQFMILSTCHSFMPQHLLEDEKVFPERAIEKGTMYVEAEDKQTLLTMGETSFVRVFEVLGIIYNSKSGKTKLKWRSLREELGKLTGVASTNSLVNLFASGTLDATYATTESDRGVKPV